MLRFVIKKLYIHPYRESKMLRYGFIQENI